MNAYMYQLIISANFGESCHPFRAKPATFTVQKARLTNHTLVAGLASIFLMFSSLITSFNINFVWGMGNPIHNGIS